MKKCCWLYATDKLSTYSACLIGRTVPELLDEYRRVMEEPDPDQDRIYYREALVRALAERGVDASDPGASGPVGADPVSADPL